MKRKGFNQVGAFVLTLVVLFTTVCAILTDAIAVKADNRVVIKLYYTREDGNYDDWSVWFWDNGKDGIDTPFEDEDGKKVAIHEVQGESPVGFIVRTQDWAKDVDMDQFIDVDAVVSGTVSVYVTSGVEGYDMEYSDDVKLGKKVKNARYNSDSTVSVLMTADLDADPMGQFTIESEAGEACAIASVESKGEGSYLITLEKALEDDGAYNLVFEENATSIYMPSIYSTPAFEEAYTYDGDDLGATYSKEKTSFRVWSPLAKAVTLKLYKDGSQGDAYEEIPMDKSEKGTWVCSKEGDLNGVYYTYLVDHNGKTREACDPYARTTGVNGVRGMVIDLSLTNPEGWDSDVNPHAGEKITDAIIYEGHIRDLTVGEDTGIVNQGKFLGLTETGTKTSDGIATGLDHMKDLGITHLHILPMYDFGSVNETYKDNIYNWGYDPMNYNVPEGSYSTNPADGSVRVNEAKQMVKALHDNDISVVMDVVYNHVMSANDFCYNRIVPGYYSRENEQGGLSNGSGCGNDVATERSMVKKYIVESVLYWATEYHIDGFRFDLVGLMDTEVINEIVSEVHAVRPDVIFYGEGWTMDTTLTKSDYLLATQVNSKETPDFAYFSDTIRDGLRGNVFDTGKTGYVSGNMEETDKIANCFSAISDWSIEPTQTVNYASCHDNNTLIDRLTISRADASREDLVRMNNLAAAIYMTSQGVPFMQAGEEMLRSKVKSDGSFDSNSYHSGDGVNALDWSMLASEEGANTYEYYKGLIAFRKAHTALRLTSSSDVANYLARVKEVPENVVAYNIKGGVSGETAEEMYVIFNPNDAAVKVDLPEGNWNIYIDGEKAGTNALKSVSNKVTVEKISAMVLVKEDTKVASKFPIAFVGGIAACVAALAVGLTLVLKRKKK